MTGSTRTARQIKITSVPTEILGRIGKKKDIFYRFKLDRSSDVNLSVSGLAAKANVDVQLLNRRRRVLDRSTNSGAAAEFISANLRRGQYFVRVINKRSKASYRLTISTGSGVTGVGSTGGDGGEAGSLTSNTQVLTAGRGQTITLNRAQLKAPGSQADRLQYKVTQAPRNGVLQLDGKTLTVGSSFTQTDIDQGRLTYRSTNPGVTVLGRGSNPKVSGFNVAWVGSDGSDNEIFFYDGSQTRQISQNGVDDKLLGIEGNHIVWASQVGAADAQGRATYELYDYDGATVRRLTNNAVNEEFFGMDGANLFWSSAVGAADRYGRATTEVFYANASGARQLTSNGVSEVIGDIDGATAVWEAALGSANAAGQATSEIYYFDGNGVRQITNNNVDDFTPRVDQGKIAWSARVGVGETGAPSSEIMLFDGATTRQLTSNNVDDAMGEIKGNTVAWMSRSGPWMGLGRSFQAFYYNGSSIQRLSNRTGDEVVVDVSDTHKLWMGVAGPLDTYGRQGYKLFYSDGSKTTQLSNSATTDMPVGMVGSKVVWYSGTDGANATREIFYFDGSKIQQLTSDSKTDDSPSFSDTMLVWRSTDGVTSQILRYDLGDLFRLQVSNGRSQAAEQVFQVNYV